MQHSLTRKTTPIALLIAFLGMLYCGLIAPSHACCVVQTERVGSLEQSHAGAPAVSACCQTRAIVLSADVRDDPAWQPYRDVLAAHFDAAVREWKQAGDSRKKRGLAGTIAAEQSGGAALVERE